MRPALLAAAQAWLAGLWAGALWCIALVAAPAAFAVLARPDAGRLVGRLFAAEAGTSLVLGVLLLLAGRRVERASGAPALNANLVLIVLSLFATVAGHYALLPLMEQARTGQGGWSFAALHGAAAAAFVVKALAVSVLAWRLTRAVPAAGPSVLSRD